MIIECPVYDLSCPYCTPTGHCTMIHPEDECDDYAAFFGDDEEEEE